MTQKKTAMTIKTSKEIITSRYIDDIISGEVERIRKERNPFVKNGYMGLCLFLFRLYEQTSKTKYLDQAQDILKQAFALLKRGGHVNIADGLSGIGLGFLYAHKKGYVTGNIYEVLKNLDSEIYKNIIYAIDYNKNFTIVGHELAMMDVALYIIEKVRLGILLPTTKKIYELFIMKLVNKLYQDLDSEFFLEPIPYSVNYKLARFVILLSKAASIGIFSQRVIHIWEECRQTILAQTPFWDCNKTHLLYALQNLSKIIPEDMQLHNSVERFKQDLSISRLTQCEFPTNAMSQISGLPGLIEVLFRMDISLTKSEIGLLKSKMETSCFFGITYDEATERNFTGLNGILGFISTYMEIEKAYEQD